MRPAPGADDDASGCSVVIKLFRVLSKLKKKPYRTITFMFYAGEEIGLVGSNEIAMRY